MEEIRLEVCVNGCVQMLHDDAVDLSELGPVKVTRASHVEFDNRAGNWYVESAKTGRLLKGGLRTRKEALAWEKEHYSPGGEGWGELTGQEE